MSTSPAPKHFTLLSDLTPSNGDRCLILQRSDFGGWAGIEPAIWSEGEQCFSSWSEEDGEWVEILDHPEDIAWALGSEITVFHVIEAVIEMNEQTKEARGV